MRRSLLTLLLGLLAGGLLGFYLGWVAFPVQIVEVVPADLDESYRADYLRLIATTYSTDENLALAQSRVASLGLPDWRAWVLAETVDAILVNPAGAETRHMVLLAAALGIDSPAFAPYLEVNS